MNRLQPTVACPFRLWWETGPIKLLHMVTQKQMQGKHGTRISMVGQESADSRLGFRTQDSDSSKSCSISLNRSHNSAATGRNLGSKVNI